MDGKGERWGGMGWVGKGNNKSLSPPKCLTFRWIWMVFTLFLRPPKGTIHLRHRQIFKKFDRLHSSKMPTSLKKRMSAYLTSIPYNDFRKKKLEIADVDIHETPSPLKLANIGNEDNPPHTLPPPLPPKKMQTS